MTSSLDGSWYARSVIDVMSFFSSAIEVTCCCAHSQSRRVCQRFSRDMNEDSCDLWEFVRSLKSAYYFHIRWVRHLENGRNILALLHRSPYTFPGKSIQQSWTTTCLCLAWCYVLRIWLTSSWYSHRGQHLAFLRLWYYQRHRWPLQSFKTLV